MSMMHRIAVVRWNVSTEGTSKLGWICVNDDIPIETSFIGNRVSWDAFQDRMLETEKSRIELCYTNSIICTDNNINVIILIILLKALSSLFTSN
jgi:hypothetical protein